MKQPARSSTRQPLISRAMKVALMAEPSAVGNDEPCDRDIRHIAWRPALLIYSMSATQSKQEENDDSSPLDCPFSRFQGFHCTQMGPCRRRARGGGGAR